MNLSAQFFCVLLASVAIAVIHGADNIPNIPEEWKPASQEDLDKYDTDRCTIPRVPLTDITAEKFAELKDEPFIITFVDGVDGWCTDKSAWTVEGLVKTYSDQQLMSGKAIEIVYKGGHGSDNVSFVGFIAEMRSETPNSDPTYLFDRTFYWQSDLPKSISPPEFLFKEGDPILFIGGSGTGATFHKHMPAWNGVLHGAKRWFLYPVTKTPPGGLYGYNTGQWLEFLYPRLEDNMKPIECVQQAGEIFYVPESYYHAVMNIGETVAISLQLNGTVTALEALFYQAMNTHYNSTVCDIEYAQDWRDNAEQYYIDMHWRLPENTEITTHLADLACESGAHDRCELILKAILQQDRYASEVRLTLSKIYYDRGDYASCEEQLVEGLKDNPTSQALLKEYGNFLWAQKRTEECETVYNRLYAAMDPATTAANNVKNVLESFGLGEEREEQDYPTGPKGPVEHEEL